MSSNHRTPRCGRQAGARSSSNSFSQVESLEQRRLLAAVSAVQFQADVAPQSLLYSFDQSVENSLEASDWSVLGLGLATALPNSGMQLAVDADGRGASLALNGGVIDDGWYEAVLSETTTALSDEHRHTFGFLRGDFNADGAVGSDDSSYLISMLMGSGTPIGPGHRSGDVNFDGTVNNQDIAAFNAQYGKRLPDLGALRAATGIATQALSSSSVRVYWNQMLGIMDLGTGAQLPPPTSFCIYRSQDGTDFVRVAEVAAKSDRSGIVSYQDCGLEEGTKYWYRVRPRFGATGLGHTSDKAWVATVLPAAEDVRVEFGDTLALVKWKASSQAEHAWRLHITDRTSTDPREWQPLPPVEVEAELASAGNKPGQRSWTVDGLSPDRQYSVTVVALNDTTQSAASVAAEGETSVDQAVLGEPELLAASLVAGNWGNVQTMIDPTPPAEPDPGWVGYGDGETVTLRVSNLPRHTAARVYLSIDCAVNPDTTMTATVGDQTVQLSQYTEWIGGRWVSGFRTTDTALDKWFESVSPNLSIQITAQNLPAGTYWSGFHNYHVYVGIPFGYFDSFHDGSEAGEPVIDPQTGVPFVEPDAAGFDVGITGPSTKPLKASWSAVADAGTTSALDFVEGTDGDATFVPDESNFIRARMSRVLTPRVDDGGECGEFATMSAAFSDVVVPPTVLAAALVVNDGHLPKVTIPSIDAFGRRLALEILDAGQKAVTIHQIDSGTDPVKDRGARQTGRNYMDHGQAAHDMGVDVIVSSMKAMADQVDGIRDALKAIEAAQNAGRLVDRVLDIMGLVQQDNYFGVQRITIDSVNPNIGITVFWWLNRTSGDLCVMIDGTTTRQIDFEGRMPPDDGVRVPFRATLEGAVERDAGGAITEITLDIIR